MSEHSASDVHNGPYDSLAGHQGTSAPRQGNWLYRALQRPSVKDTLMRASNTFFQTGLAASGVSAAMNNAGMGDVDWSRTASVAVLATLLSIAQSISRHSGEGINHK